jgi:hypothetical protein
MLATSSLVIRHVALADRGETIYKKHQSRKSGWGMILSVMVNYSHPNGMMSFYYGLKGIMFALPFSMVR